MHVMPCVVKGSASSRHSIARGLLEDARLVSLMYLTIVAIMMVSGLCAVVTCSQVSKLTPFSRAPETGPELSAAKSDSTAQKSAPLTYMSGF